jgi:uncharacterized protein YbjQ (UPF0145 family)
MIWIILTLTLAIGPWILSAVGTAIYQPNLKKELLIRETASAKTGDVLSTLSKPLSGKDVKEFQMVMASVVMSPSWIQTVVGGIVSLFGGQINIFTKVIDWARREAQQRLREQVVQYGFDEVINVRMETTTMSKIKGGKDKTTGVEILVYGTAIKY